MDELANLRRWKSEAMPLLARFDDLHGLLPERYQACLGGNKVDAVEAYLKMVAGRHCSRPA